MPKWKFQKTSGNQQGVRLFSIANLVFWFLTLDNFHFVQIDIGLFSAPVNVWLRVASDLAGQKDVLPSQNCLILRMTDEVGRFCK